MEKRLSEMGCAEEGIVKSIDGNLRNKVAGMGIRTGKKIEMVAKQPMKGPVVISVDEVSISLGFGIANKIIVEVRE